MTKKHSVARTTIILNEDEREYIRSLIKEGKEAGIKPLISKMLDVYRSMMIYDWKYPGEYYCGISRIAFVNVEFINTLLKFVPQDKWREAGKNMGEAAKISFEASLNINTNDRKGWKEAFKRLRVQGFGDFNMHDKYLVIRNPFLNNIELLAGFLEGMLNVNLEAKTSTPPFIYQVTRNIEK